MTTYISSEAYDEKKSKKKDNTVNKISNEQSELLSRCSVIIKSGVILLEIANFLPPPPLSVILT